MCYVKSFSNGCIRVYHAAVFTYYAQINEFGKVTVYPPPVEYRNHIFLAIYIQFVLGEKYFMRSLVIRLYRLPL